MLQDLSRPLVQAFACGLSSNKGPAMCTMFKFELKFTLLLPLGCAPLSDTALR